MLELADAVVVGGGVMGLFVASALSRRLSRIQLLERERCGQAATYGGFAWVNASSKWKDPEYYILNHEALLRHRALAAQHGAERSGWNGGGSLAWADGADGDALQRIRTQEQALHDLGSPVQRLTRGEMQALEPNVRFPDECEGIFSPGEGWVDTPRLTRLLRDQATERGVDVAEYTDALRFTVDYRRRISSVETSRGRVSTRILIICAGTETGSLSEQVCGNRVPMREWVGFLAETPAQPRQGQAFRVCYPPDGAGMHLRPTPGNGLLIGADDTDQYLPFDTDNRARTAHSLFARVTRSLPNAVGDGMALRRCRRPIAADGMPVVGPLPGVGDVYILLAHSGVTLAPLLAPLLAEEIITGRPDSLLSKYRPARFFPG